MINKKNFIEIKECRCCGSGLDNLLDLNDQPLANSYHDNLNELPTYPLKLNICKSCFHLQLSVVVEPNLMFENYLYVSGTTKTLREYFDYFARFTIERYKNYFDKEPQSVLDIACNDGTQLDSYKRYGLKTYGIDPATNLHTESSKNHNVICDYFPSTKLLGKYSMITAQNVFAHTNDIYAFLNSCSEIIDDQGVIFIQTSQSNMVKRNEFDTIYHEHLSFFNTLSMKTIVEKTGLKLNNVFKFDIHGSSYIFEISKTKYDSNLDSVIEIEKNQGLYDVETYLTFARNASKISSELKNVVQRYRDDGYKIVGYGAAAKGMTLLNFAKLQLDFIIDDNKLKHGLYTPGRNIYIQPIDYLNELKSVESIVFIPLAWNFFDEIKNRIKMYRSGYDDIYVKYFPNLEIFHTNKNYLIN